ncbi:MAG: hypothetical protein LUE31_08835 [Lachnospiraceae bacterium]|nr:hypothetical protein [Lachnospiraceae bacterium]
MIQYNEPYNGQYQNTIEKLSLYEKYRKEQHDSTSVIFNREMQPNLMYQNLINSTVFIYQNRVPTEGSGVITHLKGVGRKRTIGIIIQLLSLPLLAVFLLFLSNYKQIEWNDTLKLVLTFVLLFGIPAAITVGGMIRIFGRKLMIEYLEVWNSVAGKPPIEINLLTNGQLVITKYLKRDKTCGSYLSVLNPDDTVWHGTVFDRIHIPSFVEYMYVIDSVKSCVDTEDGIMIETSGRFYGARGALHSYNNHGRGESVWYCVFAQSHISYRKDEIPAILTNMDHLKSTLMNYGNYENSANSFSPFKSNC